MLKAIRASVYADQKYQCSSQKKAARNLRLDSKKAQKKYLGETNLIEIKWNIYLICAVTIPDNQFSILTSAHQVPTQETALKPRFLTIFKDKFTIQNKLIFGRRFLTVVILKWLSI